MRRKGNPESDEAGTAEEQGQLGVAGGKVKGAIQDIPLRELVPGDIVLLSAGDMIPADVRLITTKDLFISQSILTGESLPVEKYDTLGAVVKRAQRRRGSSPEARSISPTSHSWVRTS